MIAVRREEAFLILNKWIGELAPLRVMFVGSGVGLAVPGTLVTVTEDPPGLELRGPDGGYCLIDLADATDFEYEDPKEPPPPVGESSREDFVDLLQFRLPSGDRIAIFHLRLSTTN